MGYWPILVYISNFFQAQEITPTPIHSFLKFRECDRRIKHMAESFLTFQKFFHRFFTFWFCKTQTAANRFHQRKNSGLDRKLG